MQIEKSSNHTPSPVKSVPVVKSPPVSAAMLSPKIITVETTAPEFFAELEHQKTPVCKSFWNFVLSQYAPLFYQDSANFDKHVLNKKSNLYCYLYLFLLWTLLLLFYIVQVHSTWIDEYKHEAAWVEAENGPGLAITVFTYLNYSDI